MKKNTFTIIIIQKDDVTDLLLDENKYMEKIYTTKYLQCSKE